MGLTVGFIGHRNTEVTPSLKERLREIIERLIVDCNADDFLFGSKSAFNGLCYDVVTELKEKYPNIVREYIRAEYEFIPDWYEKGLLEAYEKTEFPQCVHNAGLNSYVKRNCVIVDRCEVLVAYYDENLPPRAARYNFKSGGGTKYAVDYARKKGKAVINAFVKA